MSFFLLSMVATMSIFSITYALGFNTIRLVPVCAQNNVFSSIDVINECKMNRGP
jgi:hypothetical protein